MSISSSLSALFRKSKTFDRCWKSNGCGRPFRYAAIRRCAVIMSLGRTFIAMSLKLSPALLGSVRVCPGLHLSPVNTCGCQRCNAGYSVVSSVCTPIDVRTRNGVIVAIGGDRRSLWTTNVLHRDPSRGKCTVHTRTMNNCLVPTN